MTDLNIAPALSGKLVRVNSSARLHLGFLDLNGSIGRQYGSLGLAINAFYTCVEVSMAKAGHIKTEYNLEKVESIVHRFFHTLGKDIPTQQRNIHIEVKKQIPQHAGFGSGTQLALCLGTALCKLYDIKASTHDIASHLSRGHRSGIGISTFDLGGFVVDGGSGPQTLSPPLLTHLDFPRNWRIILVMDTSQQGVYGKHESDAFKNLPTFPLPDAQTICHLTLMKLLPALAERNCDHFGEAVTEIQTLLGRYFSPAQGGSPYTSNAVAHLLSQAMKHGFNGIAQSSWGPTGCIFVENKEKANLLQTELEQFARQKGFDQIRLTTTTANNNGANIEIRYH